MFVICYKTGLFSRNKEYSSSNIEEKIMGNNFPIKRDAYFLNSIHFELSLATSFDLDQSTILWFWNEILYSGKKILWENKKMLEISNFFIYKSIIYQKDYLYFQLNLFEWLSATSSEEKKWKRLKLL